MYFYGSTILYGEANKHLHIEAKVLPYLQRMYFLNMYKSDYYCYVGENSHVIK